MLLQQPVCGALIKLQRDFMLLDNEVTTMEIYWAIGGESTFPFKQLAH